MKSVVEVLASEFGDGVLLSGDQISEKYGADWSAAPAQMPLAVLRPGSTDELSRMLQLCHQFAQPVVTQGGLTGLAGAATPESGEIALSLERMSGVEEIDKDSMTMTALAGTVLETAQEAAQAAGLYLPLDLGARGSCTLGGNVATNAGGNQVIRYGMTGDLVLGLEAVLADGQVISSLNKVIKNNSGYDLKQLFIGSEGTLGVVTRVVLKLQPQLPRTYTAFCAASNFSRIMRFFKQAQAELPGGVCAFELMWRSYFDYIIEQVSHLSNPFQQNHELYAIVQYQAVDHPAIYELFEELMCKGLEQGLLDNVLIAQSSREADTFWQIRDGIGEVIPQISPAIAFDISVPLVNMQAFVTEVEQLLKQQFPTAKLLLFGHIGDGNLHLAVCMADAEDREPVSAVVYQKVSDYNGSVSAEHGIGKLKKKYLAQSRSDTEIDLMKVLKRALDPKLILNRNRIFDMN